MCMWEKICTAKKIMKNRCKAYYDEPGKATDQPITNYRQRCYYNIGKH